MEELIDKSLYDLGPQRAEEDNKTFLKRFNGERQRYERDLKVAQRARRIANRHGEAGGHAAKEKATDGTMGGLKPAPVGDAGVPLPLGQRTSENNSDDFRNRLNGSTRRPGARRPRPQSS